MATDATGTPTTLGIPKYNTAVDPPSGKGFNAAMDAIDALLQARAIASGVTVAGGTFLQTRLLSADTQPAFRIKGDGDLEWGVGGSTAPDVNLYRVTTDILGTDDTIDVYRPTVNSALRILNAGGAQPRLRILGSGTIEWGDGTGAVDTNLYRSAANVLSTDDNLSVALQLRVVDGTSSGGVLIGGDVQLYRSAANILFTPDAFVVNSVTRLAASGGLEFGSAGTYDVNIYRSAANMLKTDDSLTIAPTAGTGEMIFTNWGASSDIDTILPGSTAGAVIKGPENSHLVFALRDNDSGDGFHFVTGGGNYMSDSTFDTVALSIRADGNIGIGQTFPTAKLTFAESTVAAGGLLFHTDTNLYRSAANMLKTDDALTVAGSDGSGIGLYLSGQIQASRTSAAGNVLGALVSGDAQYRFVANADGLLEWGSGSLTQDTNLYRVAAGALKTDGQLHIGGSNGLVLLENTGSATGGIRFGSAADTNLYRSAANTLKTDDRFLAAGDMIQMGTGIAVSGTPSNWIAISSTGAVPDVPTGGGILYVEGGTLRFRGSSGTITVIAPA